jgi:hypothetical protein
MHSPAAIVFLASPAAALINGATLLIDMDLLRADSAARSLS